MQNVYNFLYQLGVSENYKGFFYAAEAVSLCMKHQERLLCVTKSLYPDIAQKYGTNWKTVERDIRTASAIAWKRNRPLLEILAQRPLTNRPCSAEFLAFLLHAVRYSKQ